MASDFSNSDFSESELQAYLDESLAPSEMAAIESAIRANPRLLDRLAVLNRRRDAGVFTLGELWRRERLTCPARDQLVGFLAGTIPPQHAAYIQFHIDAVGCRFCDANLEDLKQQQQEPPTSVSSRRSRFYQSSAGYLRGKK